MDKPFKGIRGTLMMVLVFYSAIVLGGIWLIFKGVQACIRTWRAPTAVEAVEGEG